MARPKKESVDYFPHYCDHGKTLYIIENIYGNDGYAFFYKLMERLGKAQGHVIDTRNPADWEFLLAKTHTTEEIATDILDKLAKLNVLDAELWENRIIWMQSLVDSIADVYKKRSNPVPQKPSFRTENPSDEVQSGDGNPVSGGENPQRKKVKKESIKGVVFSPEKTTRANGTRSAKDAIAEIKNLIKFREYDRQKSIYYLVFLKDRMVDDPIRDLILQKHPCPNDNFKRNEWFALFEREYDSMTMKEAS